MANRTDAILLLASSSFLALGLASWYERVNEKPFDFVSIFGKSGAHVTVAESSIEKQPPASASPLQEAQLTSIKTELPASPSTTDISEIAVETSSAAKAAEPDKAEPATPAVALVEAAKGEPSEVKPTPANAAVRIATTDQTPPAARTVTVSLSPRATLLEEIADTVSPASTEISAAEVIRIAQELNSETESLDASGLLTTENEQQIQISTDNPLLDTTGEVKPDEALATYRVEAGDNLYRIALTHGTSVDALKQLNALVSDKLNVGDELRLPRSGS